MRVLNHATRAVALSLGVMFLSGCGSDSKEPIREFTVDGHTFQVPVRHLLSTRIIWFPRLEKSRGFNFAANPDDESGKKILVTVEPRNITCRPDKVAASPMLRQACSPDGLELPEQTHGDLLEKVHINGEGTQWTYVVTRHSSEVYKYPIAGCYMLDAKNHRGSCNSLGRYEQVVYSLSFGDADIERLAEIRQRVEALLSVWEKQ